MLHALEFTAAEAAFVLREPVKTVRKALDDGPVRGKLVAKAGGRVRMIAWTDLVFLYAVRSLRDELTPKARGEFYSALKRRPTDGTNEVRFGRLSVAIDDFKAEAETRARELNDLAEKVEFRADGEAVLKGGSIEVYRISALAEGGLSVDDICADFASLTRDGVSVATNYAAAYPKSGRPFPRTTSKRALRGAGLEALDEASIGDADAR